MFGVIITVVVLWFFVHKFVKQIKAYFDEIKLELRLFREDWDILHQKELDRIRQGHFDD